MENHSPKHGHWRACSPADEHEATHKPFLDQTPKEDGVSLPFSGAFCVGFWAWLGRRENRVECIRQHSAALKLFSRRLGLSFRSVWEEPQGVGPSPGIGGSLGYSEGGVTGIGGGDRGIGGGGCM